MAYVQNHVIDPNYFDEAIEEFAFDYNWFVRTGVTVDDLGRSVTKFEQQTIHGSLQPEGSNINFRVEGNTTNLKYKFYCKSLYRITTGDFILYKNRYLHVDGWHDYDEWGVRECSLTMVNLSEYHDFKEYLEYLEGEKIV